jgi:hypothetical protein
MVRGHCANYRRSKLSRGPGRKARRHQTPWPRLVTKNKMRTIRNRLQKLARLFPVKPACTPEQVISEMAMQRVSCEDLLALRRMILSRQAGHSASEWDEQGSRALVAYRSAFAQEARRAGYSLTAVRSRPGADRPDGRSSRPHIPA